MSHRRRCLCYMVLMLVTLTSLGRLSLAATAGAPENISNSPQHSEAPQAAAAGSTLHVVWGERETATIATSQKANGGTWPAATLLNTGTKTAQQWTDTVVTSDGTSHIVYAVGDAIYHRSKPKDVTSWSEAHLIASDSFPNPTRMAAAPDGTLWVVWRDGNGTAIRYRRSTNAGISWSGGDVFAEAGNMFAPDIAVGSDNIPHIVWYLRSGTENRNSARYADWTGASWNVGSIGGPGGYVADPVITVDSKNAQHVAYRRQNGSNWTIQHITRVPGQSWANQTDVRTMSGDAAYAPGLAVDRQGGVHMTWSELNAGGGRDVWYSLKQAGQSFATPANVSENSGGWNSRSTVVVTDDASGTAAHIFYQRGLRGQDVDEIYYRRFVNAAPVPPLTGSLTINGGATVTNNRQVNVSISNTSATGVPTSYSLADGRDPGTPNVPFSNPTTSTSFTLDVADGLCRVHTVYAKLGNTTSQSAAFAGTIMYDASAEAGVEVRNPNLPSNSTNNDYLATAVPSGDTAFTRRPDFNTSIWNGPNECSGLTRYALVRHGKALTAGDWRAVPAEGFVSAFTRFMPDLPSNNGQGAYQFDVYVEDKLGNTSPAPYVVTIMYDVTGPTLLGANGPLPTTHSPKGGVAYLNTSTLTADDNMYVDPLSGRKHWGFWVVVKKDSAGAPTETDWNVYGSVQAGKPNSTHRWNMADGLIGGIQGFTPGAHTVYIRYLDGAGNWSNTVASQSIPVQQLEFFNHLPFVSR